MKIEIITHEAHEIMPGNTKPLGICTVGCKIEYNGKQYGDYVKIQKEKLTLQDIEECGGLMLKKVIMLIRESEGNSVGKPVIPEGHKVVGKSKFGFPIIEETAD